MMPKLHRWILLWAFLLLGASSVSAQEAVRASLRLTLQDIHGTSRLSPASFESGRWTERGPVMTYIVPDPRDSTTHLVSFNLENERREMLIDGSTLLAKDVGRLIEIEDYEYSVDGSSVLIFTDSEPVWRHNTKGYYYVYEIDSRRLTPLSGRDKGFQMFAKFDPMGERVAFVRDRNLFVVDLQDMTERQLTFDGAEGTIINGTSDWVYEEEFGLRDGWAWSPDGAYIAYIQLDETETREFVMADLRGQYPELTRFKYPKAGEVNSEVRVGIVDPSTGGSTFFETGTWNAGGDSLEYIPQLGWTPEIDGSHYVWMLRLNRDQNVVELLYGNPADGSLRTVLREEDDFWVDVETSFGDLEEATLRYLDDGRHFVWMSERDGYRHLYLYRNDGTFLNRLTEGEWNVTAFHGVDSERNLLYFTATIDGPLERHLYRQPFLAASQGSNGQTLQPERITEREGTHKVSMSPDFQYYIDRFSNVRTPTIASLHRADGAVLRILENNEELVERLARYDLPYAEFIQVPGADGTPLNAYIIRPTSFDPAGAYPLLMHVYGGPGSQEVENAWDAGNQMLWHQYLAAEHGIIVAAVDNRGTGGRSKAFKSATHKQLGLLEAEDQIAAAKQFGALDYVEADRIGIWGWSYGGYMTLMSMLTGDGPSTFKMGVSVAPLVDWRLYDTIYTERYMSTPERNPEGYELSAPARYADRLSDEQKLLLVHGDLDDNVHLQNAIQMIDALQRAGKQFDLMIYPGRDHSISGDETRLHLFQLITDFIRENL